MLKMLKLLRQIAVSLSCAIGTLTPTATFASDEIRPSTGGFYPIWENTSYVEKHREIYIGTNGAHYGILDRAQIGVQPINFIYRSPNAYLKFLVHQNSDWHLSAQV